MLDVDTGVDDALALIFALRSPALRVTGVTCGYGNTDVEAVVANTLRVVGSAVPVARGAAAPLSGAAPAPRPVHGADGMGDLSLPPPTARPVPPGEVPWAPTVIALGPLTNLVDRVIEHLVLVGGDVNLGADPDAAARVLAAAGRVTVYWPVFADVPLYAADVARLPGLAGRLAAHQVRRGAGLGDAGAVAAVIAPELLTTRRGMLCGADVDLAATVDSAAVRRLFLLTVG